MSALYLWHEKGNSAYRQRRPRGRSIRSLALVFYVFHLSFIFFFPIFILFYFIFALVIKNDSHAAARTD